MVVRGTRFAPILAALELRCVAQNHALGRARKLEDVQTPCEFNELNPSNPIAVTLTSSKQDILPNKNKTLDHVSCPPPLPRSCHDPKIRGNPTRRTLSLPDRPRSLPNTPAPRPPCHPACQPTSPRNEKALFTVPCSQRCKACAASANQPRLCLSPAERGCFAGLGGTASCRD
jgi:hypothetical protein